MIYQFTTKVGFSDNVQYTHDKVFTERGIRNFVVVSSSLSSASDTFFTQLVEYITSWDWFVPIDGEIVNKPYQCELCGVSEISCATDEGYRGIELCMSIRRYGDEYAKKKNIAVQYKVDKMNLFNELK